MEIVRIIALAVIAYFLIAGIRRGLIRQVLEVVGIVLAFIAAFYLAHTLAEWIGRRVSVDYRAAVALAAVAIFTGIIIFVHFVGLGAQRLFKLTVMGMFDHAAGGVFGALKGILLVSLVLSMIMVLPLPDDMKKEIREDPVTGVLYPVLPVMFDLVIGNIPGGQTFERIARIGESDAVGKAKKGLNELKEGIEKKKDELEEGGKD